MLAIFAVADRSIHEATAAAINATRGAFAALAALKKRRAGDGRRPLEFGVALHRDVVTYGDIGAHDRLDFTVIGPAVNDGHPRRVPLKDHGHRLLLTESFATSCHAHDRARLRSVGRHALCGVSAPV